MRKGLPISVLLLASLAGGCRNCDRVENELRARDVQYREALEEMMRTEAVNEDLRRENEALRAGGKLTPEQAAQTFGVKKIVLGRGTSGVDNDRVPGDEALQVWVEPRDASDHTIKAPGTIQLAVLEVNPQGGKQLLSTWDFTPDQVKLAWKQGLLSIGYMLEVKWKTPPRVETIRVVARFTLPDGRWFEADKDIKVRLMPGAASRPEAPPGLQSEGPAFRPTLEAVSVQPTGKWSAAPNSQSPTWQREPLQDAVGLQRPMPVAVPESTLWYRPMVGDIRVED